VRKNQAEIAGISLCGRLFFRPGNFLRLHFHAPPEMFKLNNAEKPHAMPHRQALYPVMTQSARNITEKISGECLAKDIQHL
jgi:hypothetical protein